MDPIRVILVDGDPASAAASSKALRQAGIAVVAHVESGEEAVRSVKRSHATVAVIDLDIGGLGPATTARRIRSSVDHRVDIVAQAPLAKMHDIGDMIATGTSAYVVKGKLADLVDAVRAVAGGTGLLSDEASKPLLEELHRRYEAERIRGQELEQAVARLEAASVTDWLTGLKNHGYFWERLAEELQRARRYSRPLAVIMADLDDFKAINDEYGHATGDEVLRATGEAIAASVRESDVACRVGGEEFAILVPETSAAGALQLAERIRDAVGAMDTSPVGAVTLSLGVAVYPFHATDGRSLVEAADQALYDAKHAGKNCSRVAGGPSERPVNPPEPFGPAVVALLGALHLRDSRTVAHAERVGDIAFAIGHEVELATDDLERLRLAAWLHDLGTLAIRSALLEKSGPLTAAEWRELHRVPELGAELIERAVNPEVARIVAALREHPDGSGYPNGLVATEIPLGAKILAVADAYDALLLDKAYRAAKTVQEALDDITSLAGGRFDTEVVEVLRRLVGEGLVTRTPEFPDEP